MEASRETAVVVVVVVARDNKLDHGEQKVKVFMATTRRCEWMS
jgi:hypothetical protein